MIHFFQQLGGFINIFPLHITLSYYERTMAIIPNITGSGIQNF